MSVGRAPRWKLLAAGLLLASSLGSCALQRPAPGQAPVSVAAATAWERHTVDELQSAMAEGQLSAEALASHFLDRIATLDDDGPRLNAVIELNPEALAIARALDEERASGRTRGPLHGIPVLLKDNIDTDDAMATSAGSLALAAHRPGRDATLVARLREAGAVILGKTNLSEWANFRSTNSTSGWSSRGGQTRNPHVLDRNPCGSSSGSAVAVAAGLAPLAVGTETDGSIVCPAAANGVVGFKPGVGLVSRHGIVPISASQDTAGAFARRVADAELLLAAIAGADPADPSTADSPGYLPVAATGTTALAGARIGVLRRHFGMHPDADRTMDAMLASLATAGAVIVDPVEIPTHGSFSSDEFEVLLYEFHEGIDRYLAETAAPHRDLESLVAWNREHADVAMPWFGQELFEMALERGPDTRAAYLEARERARRLAGAEGIDAVMREHRLDALLAPTTGPAWVTDPVNGDHYAGGSSSAAATAGYPLISVPVGQVHGLPVGATLMGGHGSERRLAALASAIEAAWPAFREPAYLPRIEP